MTTPGIDSTPPVMPAFGRDETLPWLFRAADAASNSGQRAFMQFTSITLIMLVIGAGISPVIQLVTDSESTQRWSALFAAAAFVIAIIERSYTLTTRPERSWYEGRALAESAKTLAWRYAVGAAPYEIDSANVDTRFAERLRNIVRSFPELQLDPTASSSQQITPEMRALRTGSLEQRRLAYREDRIEDQRVWYAARAARHGRRGQRLGLLTLLAECCGVTLAILFAADVLPIDLLSIAASSAAGLIAWERAHQDTTIAKAYGVAAHELATIRDLIDQQQDEASWSLFVVEAEDAVSREHTLWKASRSVDTGLASEEH